MRKVFIPAVLLFILPWPVMAQSPKAELFGGYSFLRIEKTDNHGWNASLAGIVNPNLAIVADFSGHYNRENFTTFLGNTETKSSLHSFLVGPRVSEAATPWLTPFAHLLLGYARVNSEVSVSGNPATTFTELHGVNGFGLVLGGGMDVVGNKPLGFRLIQVDYDLVRIEGFKHAGVRVSTGLLVRFGHKSH
jgi:hypothetical protein